ncbi:MAG: hypothetical protein Kilf2KO_44780 [Rhodospirillales bacterium]
MKALTALLVCVSLIACSSEGRPIGTVVKSTSESGDGAALPNYNTDSDREGGSAGAAIALAVIWASAALIFYSVKAVRQVFSEDQLVLIMTEKDREAAGAAYSAAYLAPEGQPQEWYNPGTGNGGTVVPVEPGEVDDGEACREFWHYFQVNGRVYLETGPACRDPQGFWRLL